MSSFGRVVVDNLEDDKDDLEDDLEDSKDDVEDDDEDSKDDLEGDDEIDLSAEEVRPRGSFATSSTFMSKLYEGLDEWEEPELQNKNQPVSKDFEPLLG